MSVDNSQSLKDNDSNADNNPLETHINLSVNSTNKTYHHHVQSMSSQSLQMTQPTSHTDDSESESVSSGIMTFSAHLRSDQYGYNEYTKSGMNI